MTGSAIWRHKLTNGRRHLSPAVICQTHLCQWQQIFSHNIFLQFNSRKGRNWTTEKWTISGIIQFAVLSKQLQPVDQPLNMEAAKVISTFSNLKLILLKFRWCSQTGTVHYVTYIYINWNRLLFVGYLSELNLCELCWYDNRTMSQIRVCAAYLSCNCVFSFET